ncbi:MAG: molybdopterin-guanine dinucleotide biosynthesis protein B [Clostridiales Family XIII bacterium]|jgi:molybdopterin-guanine dinucleotide biosynthesis protein B|nr:molybdopterin-guanine dinucleotide biosynthesis protein B [Clostridiales Family XIII bacterium]
MIIKKNPDGQIVVAVSGKKNSGKTTLIEALLPLLTQAGVKVAVVKHHGHRFEGDIPDTPETDTYRFFRNGAYATAIFDDELFGSVVRKTVTESDLIAQFADAGLILLEGFKHTDWPKILLVRDDPATYDANAANVLAVVTNVDLEGRIPENTPVFDPDDRKSIAAMILDKLAGERESGRKRGEIER